MVRILDLTAIQQADIDSNDHLVISNVGGSPMASSRVRVEDFVQYTLAGGSLGFATKSEVDSAIDANNTLHFPFTINAGLGLDSLSNGILDSANDTITIKLYHYTDDGNKVYDTDSIKAEFEDKLNVLEVKNSIYHEKQ